MGRNNIWSDPVCLQGFPEKGRYISSFADRSSLSALLKIYSVLTDVGMGPALNLISV